MNTKTHPNNVCIIQCCTMQQHYTTLRYINFAYNNPMNTATGWVYQFRIEQLVIHKKGMVMQTTTSTTTEHIHCWSVLYKEFSTATSIHCPHTGVGFYCIFDCIFARVKGDNMHTNTTNFISVFLIIMFQKGSEKLEKQLCKLKFRE